MRYPYSLLKRRSSKSGRYIYYARFWDFQEKRYQTARSLQVMAEEMGLDPDEFSAFTRVGARFIAEKWMQTGRHIEKPKKKTPVGVYLETFWDWDTSDYIKGKLARKKSSIGVSYAKSNKSWIQRYVNPRIGQISLEDLRTHHLEKLVMSLKAETDLAPQTINSVFQAVRVALTEAHRLNLIDKNPATPIQPFGVEREVKGILTTEEIQKLLDLDWRDFRPYVAFNLALVAGLRMGEVQALKDDDILPGGIMVRHSFSKVSGLKGTKTNKEREIPVPEEVLKMLRKLIRMRPHQGPWVFWRKEDPEKPMNDKEIHQGFYWALETIGIPDDRTKQPRNNSRQVRGLSFHSLRHSCNSLLRGVLPDTKLRLLTGHQSEAMSNHYDHLTDLDRNAILRAQEERLFNRKKS